MKRLSLLFTIAILAIANIANAQIDSLVTEEKVESKGKLTFNGYLDTYYEYNFNKPSDRLNKGRVFDPYHDNFSVGLIQTMLTYSKDRVTAVADLAFGPTAELASFGNAGTTKIIKQAYISYAITDKFLFTIGQYGTHIGYEFIDAPLNFNYNISYLFGNGPFYHTGAKLDYNFNSKVGVMVGIVDGWDGISEFNNKKSLAAQLRLAPVEGLNFYANWLAGDEYKSAAMFGDHSDSYTSVYDFVATYQITDKLKLGAQQFIGTFKTGAIEPDPEDAWSEDAEWGGTALYASYKLNDFFGLGIRAERYSDPNGIRYIGAVRDLSEITITGDVNLAKGKLLVKPEFRIDKSKDDYFLGSDGIINKNTQTTLGVAFIYKFNADIIK